MILTVSHSSPLACGIGGVGVGVGAHAIERRRNARMQWCRCVGMRVPIGYHNMPVLRSFRCLSYRVVCGQCVPDEWW